MESGEANGAPQVPDKVVIEALEGSQDLEVSGQVFGYPNNPALIHQVATSWYDGARRGTSAQKGRGEVRGGGRKPWQQKRTGRARAGSKNSPIWRGGGKHFANKTRDYSKKVNRKMYRLALRAILSDLVRRHQFRAVDCFDFAEPKTRLVANFLGQHGLDSSRVLLLGLELSPNLELAARNIQALNYTLCQSINPAHLVQAEMVVAEVAGIRAIEGWLA